MRTADEDVEARKSKTNVACEVAWTMRMKQFDGCTLHAYPLSTALPVPAVAPQFRSFSLEKLTEFKLARGIRAGSPAPKHA